MLTVKLNAHQNLDLSRSSYNDDELDLRKLTNVVDQQKKTIRRLTSKIQKLEETLKKERQERGVTKNSSSQPNQNEYLLSILKTQMDKTRQVQELLNKTLEKITQIINQSHFERLFPPNPQTTPQNRPGLKKNSIALESNLNIQAKKKNQRRQKQETQTLLKQLHFLQTGLKLLNENYQRAKCQNQQLLSEFQKFQYFQELLKREAQNRSEIQRQLDVERRMRIKLKSLLEKSECEKNILLMKIDRVAVNQKQIHQKKREEWVHISKSLTLKISDLEKQKRQIQEENLREKENWTKKYGQLLQTVKSMQIIRK